MNPFKVLRIAYPISIILFWGLSIKFYTAGVPERIEMILVFYSMPAFSVVIVIAGTIVFTIILLIGLFFESIISGENKFK